MTQYYAHPKGIDLPTGKRLVLNAGDTEPNQVAPMSAVVHTGRVPFAQFDQPPGLHGSLPGPTGPEGPVFLAADSTRGSSIHGALESGAHAARTLPGDSAPAVTGRR